MFESASRPSFASTRLPLPSIPAHLAAPASLDRATAELAISPALWSDWQRLSASLGASPQQALMAAVHGLAWRFTGQNSITTSSEAVDGGAWALPDAGQAPDLARWRVDNAAPAWSSQIAGEDSFAKLCASMRPARSPAEADLRLIVGGEPSPRLAGRSSAFDRPTVWGMSEALAPLMRAVLANPGGKLHEAPIVDDRLAARLALWNQGNRNVAGAGSVHELVLRTAADRARRIALEDAQGRRFTYRQIDAASATLAAQIVERGAAGGIVAIEANRSAETMIAMLATLRAGAGYLPLDPTYPPKRLAQMLEHARPALRLAPVGAERGPAPEGIATLPVAVNSLLASSPAPHRDQGGPCDLAYVIYTSGSTGEPKGVAMPHAPLVNLISWQLRQWGNRASARTLQFAPLGFDVSFQEVFSTWAAGGTLVLVEPDVRSDPRALLDWVCRARIERLFLPVVALQYLAEESAATQRWPRRLREVITAGEALELTPAVRRFFDEMPRCELVNQYGPTETHVVTAHRVSGGVELPPRLPPIGRPIDNVRVWIADESGRSAPPGATGELYLGGRALAQGYLFDADRTSQRFVADPQRPGERLYRTGDLARWLPEGDIEFLGRADGQVKIRGYRVEPGEVAAALELHEAVAKAAVVAEKGPAGDKRLAGFVRLRSALEDAPARLTAFLRERLADHMVPARLAVVDAFPQTASGKVDYRKLIELYPADLARETLAATSAPPRTAEELAVAEVWQSLLGCAVGRDDDFLTLGGNSLLAMHVVAELERRHGWRIPVATVATHGTLSGFAGAIAAAADPTRWSPLVPLAVRAGKPRLYLMHPAGGNALCYLKLAQRMKANHSVWGIQAAGVDGVRERAKTVDAMASDYLAAIDAQEADDAEMAATPIWLGGWSLGGAIALEMARRLNLAGRAVAGVVVMDMGVMYSFAVQKTLFPQVGLTTMMLQGEAAQMDLFRSGAGATQIVPPGASESQMLDIMRTFLSNLFAFLRHSPAYYNGPVTLLKAIEPIVVCRHDPAKELAELCTQLTCRMVPGNHITLIDEPHVNTLAATLDDVLGAPK